MPGIFHIVRERTLKARSKYLTPKKRKWSLRSKVVVKMIEEEEELNEDEDFEEGELPEE
jgi:hypothetical protein